MKSWKTTAVGILAAVTSISMALGAMFDNYEHTEPDWAIVATTVMAAVGLLFARDNDKSSESVDAK